MERAKFDQRKTEIKALLRSVQGELSTRNRSTINVEIRVGLTDTDGGAAYPQRFSSYRAAAKFARQNLDDVVSFGCDVSVETSDTGEARALMGLMSADRCTVELSTLNY